MQRFSFCGVSIILFSKNIPNNDMVMTFHLFPEPSKGGLRTIALGAPVTGDVLKRELLLFILFICNSLDGFDIKKKKNKIDG